MCKTVSLGKGETESSCDGGVRLGTGKRAVSGVLGQLRLAAHWALDRVSAHE